MVEVGDREEGREATSFLSWVRGDTAVFSAAGLDDEDDDGWAAVALGRPTGCKQPNKWSGP